jgi:hypothetical protein
MDGASVDTLRTGRDGREGRAAGERLRRTALECGDTCLITLGIQGENMHEYGVSLFGVAYIIIGVVVALTNGYALHSIGELLSFLLAMFLWPLVLLGVNLHIVV